MRRTIADFIVLGVVAGCASGALESHRIGLAAFLFFCALAFLLERCADKVIEAIKKAG
jgi:hypothetical protein